MGRKRKLGQSKQNWGSTNSRKQRKKRKTRGKGFKQAKVSNEVDSLHIEPSTSTTCKLSLTAIRERSESSCCAISCASADESMQRLRLWKIGVILSRLKNLASFCQHFTVDWCFRSIRSVYLILNWLKQTFGCGIQTLGKVSCLFVLFCIKSDSLILSISLHRYRMRSWVHIPCWPVKYCTFLY